MAARPIMVPGGQGDVLRANASFIATSAQIARFKLILQGAAAVMFGASEGTQLIERFELYNTADCTDCGGHFCDVCFGTDRLDVSYTSYGIRRQIDVAIHNYDNSRTDIADVVIMAHELTHFLFAHLDALGIYEQGIGDEYDGSGHEQCGHSIMNGPDLDQNNFNWCYFGDHATDYSLLSTPSSVQPVWDYAASVAPFYPTNTPDNFSYFDFSFYGAVGFVDDRT